MKGDIWDFVLKGIMCECDYIINVVGVVIENIELESVVVVEVFWVDVSVSYMIFIFVFIDLVFYLVFLRVEYIN